MENIINYSFNGNEIAFIKGSDRNVMINATEMAKTFNKRPNDWLNLPSTKDFLFELSIKRKNGNSDYQAVITKIGAPENGGGTWLHEDAAIEFARWLSPKFAIWCNDRIKELLTQGVSTIANDDETILKAMQVLQRRVEESKAKQRELETANAQLSANNASLAYKNNELSTTIEKNAPKVRFAEAVEDSDDTVLIREFAKTLQQNGIKMGEIAIFKWMRINGYLLSKGDSYNLPSQKSMQKDLFRIKKTTIINSDGTTKVTTTPKLTGKGQVYFLSKLS